jgi:hypothetical protein
MNGLVALDADGKTSANLCIDLPSSPFDSTVRAMERGHKLQIWWPQWLRSS